MQRKASIPRRPRQRSQADRQQRREEVLARVRELRERARRGETPEEIIDKGVALMEIKRLKPWRYEEDRSGGFAGWVQRNLPYGVARAYDYMRIANRVEAGLVAGLLICFEALLELSRAPRYFHIDMIEAAVRGASAAELREIGSQMNPKLPSAAAAAKAVLRRQAGLKQALHQLAEDVAEGEEVPAETLARLKQEHAEVGALIAKLDPNGSSPGPAGPPAGAARSSP